MNGTIRHGGADDPGRRRLRRIADALGVPVSLFDHPAEHGCDPAGEQDEEALADELLAAFAQIRSPVLRRRVLALVKSLAGENRVSL